MEATEKDNLDRRMVTINERKMWIAVTVIVISIITGLLGAAQITGATMQRVEYIEQKQNTIDARVTALERITTGKLTEMTVNMKVLMRAQGLEYQEAE